MRTEAKQRIPFWLTLEQAKEIAEPEATIKAIIPGRTGWSYTQTGKLEENLEAMKRSAEKTFRECNPAIYPHSHKMQIYRVVRYFLNGEEIDCQTATLSRADIRLSRNGERFIITWTDRK